MRMYYSPIIILPKWGQSNKPHKCLAVIFIPIFRKDDETMAEGVRKRGKTWSYYFDTARLMANETRLKRVDSAPRKKHWTQGLPPLQNITIPADHSHPKRSALLITWTIGWKL